MTDKIEIGSRVVSTIHHYGPGTVTAVTAHAVSVDWDAGAKGMFDPRYLVATTD
jgi:hypothetical protein